LITDFSKTLTFHVLSAEKKEKKKEQKEEIKLPAGCHKVNLNCDLNKKNQQRINFVDVSILLYNWGRPKNKRADLNNDGWVNYTDLSILLYYWTG
ncbi:MAG: hypothetical protein N2259_00895, partial [Patescibacteria group bacterium]|nr:hypothetical protein [Patescibacteria group bacterium]